VIATTGESDFFTFYTAGGDTSISVNVASEGPSLDARVELYRIAYYRAYPYLAKVAEADPAGLNASLSQYLSAGNYYVAVRSHGTYGDVGQYTVNVTKWKPVSWNAPLLTSQIVAPFGMAPDLARSSGLVSTTVASASAGGWDDVPRIVSTQPPSGMRSLAITSAGYALAPTGGGTSSSALSESMAIRTGISAWGLQ
jgi:hypothetical protein